jgi:uncharacterized membrane protein
MKPKLLVFGVFLAFDIFWAGQYLLFGAPVLLGGRLGTYLPSTVEEGLLVIFLGLGSVSSGLAARRSSMMEFFEDSVSVRMRGYPKTEIHYDEISKIESEEKTSNFVTRVKLRFYRSNESRPYSIPKEFGLNEDYSSFRRWFEERIGARAS